MARKDDFRGNTMRCVVCTNPIPPERKWDSITCSKELYEGEEGLWPQPERHDRVPVLHEAIDARGARALSCVEKG
jgi:hypothetical protein